MQKRNEFHPVLPLEGKVSPQATEEVSYRYAVRSERRRSATKIISPVIRLAGDAGCHPPLKGRDFARSPFRRTQKRNEFHPVLPLEGKVSPLATEEVSYRIAVCFDGCKSGTSSTQSFPLRGRCRRRRRKRCRTGSQFVSTNAKAERMTPLPSSGLRETPDATLPSRGGILRVDLFPFPDEPCRSPSAFRRTELLLKNGKQFLNYRNNLLTNDMKSAMVKKNRPEGSP